MAGTPEEFPVQGGPEPEPFSPSVFLDLPPTPSEEDPPASTDDLALTFISRILMEEDIDEKFLYHYPDHPALLQAQQPFAQILSDAGASSDFFATNNDGSGACTLPPSSDVPALANTTWPYDPVEFPQLFLSSPCPDMGVGIGEFTADDANRFLLPQQDAASARFQRADKASSFRNCGSAGIQCSELLAGPEEETTTSTTSSPPTGDREHGALASTFFSGQNRVNIDMLNQAFLRGMEEAKKFLPIDSSLLVEARGCKPPQVFIPGHARNEDKVDRMLTFQGISNARSRKKWCNWQDLESTEMSRNSKLMALAELEETDEIIDEIILNEYRLCLNGMLGLDITMDSKDGNFVRKGNWKSALRRRTLNEAVDFHTLLIHCAQAISTDDRWSAAMLLGKIKQHSSPRGDANQRLAHCFADGLEARLAGTGSQVYKSLMSKRTSQVDILKAYQLYLTVCCFKMMAYKFSNMTIANVIGGRRKLHIVDYGMRDGIQWPSFLGILSTWEGGPPEVRITGIDLPQPGFRPAAHIEEIGRRLSKCARQFGIPFKFQSIAAKWEMVSVDDLNIDPDEALIINGLFDFGNLMDEGVDIYSPSPRDMVLNNIREMRPDVFIFCNVNGSHGTPFFVTRFREVLFFFSALFDMLDVTVPRDNDRRLLIERVLFGRFAMNVIACEGSDRVERHETYKQWQVRNHRAGLKQLPLDPDIVKVVRNKVKDSYHKDFVIDMDHQWLLEGWKGRIICAMSTWVADDAFSEH
ncbi:hypothetical protein BDA96_02G332300 [Sorghum bicolor]|uniref:Scarecrow-like protein 9 n=1 Tax=Sorghum bicolor TaxID=4558 RepID=A0A921RST4_SORBI|nr:hypothetical protein BDA96_02G332300 [Sorghum bicolor]